MARFIGYLFPIPRERGQVRRSKRTLAIAAIIALLTATVAPTWAVAAEADSEGEGTAPPGLENPHFEPGGEETALESLPDAAESEGRAEVGEGPPMETEPSRESELPEPAPSAEEAVPPVVAEPEPPPPPAEAPSPATPEYAPAAPEYVAPVSSSAPVENEPIVAPSSSAGQPPQAEGRSSQPEPEAAPLEAVPEVPPAAVPSSEQEVPPPAPAPAAVTPNPGSGGVSPPLRGRSSYTVRPGDCLWSIAEALLPGSASNEEIAAEVSRLWRLNAEQIGTGDPNVILSGTLLALG
jgi:LysM domain